jgi:hypothetical protein
MALPTYTSVSTHCHPFPGAYHTTRTLHINSGHVALLLRTFLELSATLGIECKFLTDFETLKGPIPITVSVPSPRACNSFQAQDDIEAPHPQVKTVTSQNFCKCCSLSL